MKDFDKRLTLFFSNDILQNRQTGLLYGYFQNASATVNVLSCGQPPERPISVRSPVVVGRLYETLAEAEQEADPSLLVRAYYDSESINAISAERTVNINIYSLLLDSFSRHSGILETEKLLSRRAIISGCGSVGGLAALHLARAGVGNFLLLDNDILKYENLSRHEGTITDIGRYKVELVRDKILDINPHAIIEPITKIIEEIPKGTFDRWCVPGTVIIGCADNREADLYANKIACLYGLPLVSIGLWERAFAGEIFWTVPGQKPCYYCLFGGRSALSHRQSSNRRLYTSEESLSKVNFEPGIYLDISFVTLIGIKLALALLSKDSYTGGDKLLNDLEQFTLVCNTNNKQMGGDLAEIFDHSLQITRSVKCNFLSDCPHCKLTSRIYGHP